MSSILGVLIAASLASAGAAPVFVAAKPIWPEGRAEEKNCFAGFRAIFDAPDAPVLLRATGSTLYRVFLNGSFLGHGPARAAHGHYRIDEWDLTPLLQPGVNVIAFEVAGYNANSYYVLDQPSFLQAEAATNAGRILAATGHGGHPFEAAILEERVQKVQRYSFQRPFIEVYRLAPEVDRWRSDPEVLLERLSCAVAPEKKLLARGVPYPDYGIVPAQAAVARGTFETGVPVKRPWRDRSLAGIGPELGGFPMDDLDVVISDELMATRAAAADTETVALTPASTLALQAGQFQTLDLGVNRSGFPRLHVSCRTPVRLVVTFDEDLRDGQVDWRRLGCVNALTYELEAGDYDLESFEPYTLRYLNLMVFSGECTVSACGLRSYENPDTKRAVFEAPDERLNRIFEAGRSTFAQNAVDIFMDCPHRERAGWLCDSFFAARAAMALSGDTEVERNFIENYLLPDRFEHLPEGMLSMCYPADHYNGVFIPNWALWFVLELGEYLDRSGDRAMVDALKPRVLALFDYFKPFQNDDGLLEKLDSWVFIEWSEANRFTQDVNYPSNMLYAAALDTAAQLYGIDMLALQAEAIRKVIRAQSFDGAFFVDNAQRTANGLEVTRNRSEVCQYYAFYFGVATPESHPDLWRILRDDFGPERSETKVYAKVHPANSFVGNMLRMELLSREGRSQQILDESIDYLLYMAERTGTLWENVGDNASLNHGFAAHIVHTLYRDVLGLYRVDPVARKATLRFCPVDMAWCKGVIAVEEGTIRLEWRQDEDGLTYFLDTPEGFDIKIENPSGRPLRRAETPP